MGKIELLEAAVKGINGASKEIRAFVNGLVDDSSFVETDTFLSGKSLLDGSLATGEGVLTGYAAIDGNPVYIVAQNSAVLGGSFGIGQAKKIIKCMEGAIKSDYPLITVLDSSGARVGEGVTCLEGYASVLAKAAEVQANVPHIVIVKGGAIGHMAAYLSLADFVFAGKDAVISFNPPSVLVANTAKPAKDVFGAKVHSSESGLIDFKYASDAELRNKIALLLDYTGDYSAECSDDPNRETAALASDASAATLLAALTDEGRCLEYAEDYAKEIRCCFARVNGASVGIAVSNAAVSEYLTLAGADKLCSFANLLDAFDLPFISIVNSKGLNTTIADEQCCAVSVAGKLLSCVASLSVPRISVVAGNAVGIAYTALVSKGIGFDYSVAFPAAYISPLNADTSVSLVYSRELAEKGNTPELREKLEELHKEENGSPYIAAKEGYLDEIIHPSALRPYIANALLMLLGL